MPTKQNRSEQENTITKAFSIRPEIWEFIKEYAETKDYTYSRALCEIIGRFRDGDK